MKKSICIISLLSVISLVLTACSLLDTEVPLPEQKSASGTVCLVTDTKGINDRSFNATAWKGVTDAQAQLGVVGVYLESEDDTFYDVNISAFIQGGCDLIVTVGYMIGDSTASAAEAHPEQKFAIVDYDFFNISVDPPVDVTFENVKELTFRTDQAAFLAGYVAAGVTRTGKLGTFGGLEIPTVTSFMDGFSLGVSYYNEKHGTDVQALGWDPVLRIGLFTDTFDVVQKGATLGEALIAEGVDIIMPVAGGVGLGTAAVAKDRSDVYIIGVDTDWTVSAPEYSDIVLTSVLKNMDVAVFNASQEVIDGNFSGGLYIGTLANDGVGLASFHNLDSLVSDELKLELEQVKADIIAGNIQTLP
jgi:basic membrane protein A